MKYGNFNLFLLTAVLQNIFKLCQINMLNKTDCLSLYQDLSFSADTIGVCGIKLNNFFPIYI